MKHVRALLVGGLTIGAAAGFVGAFAWSLEHAHVLAWVLAGSFLLAIAYGLGAAIID